MKTNLKQPAFAVEKQDITPINFGVNLDKVKKQAKRIAQINKKFDHLNVKNLAQAQEIISYIYGWQNWHQFQSYLSHPSIGKPTEQQIPPSNTSNKAILENVYEKYFMNLLQFAFAHKVQSILFQKHDTFTFEIKMKNDSGILLPYADIGPDFGEALCKFIFEEWIEGGSHTPFDIKNFISARKEIPSIPINVHLNFMPVYPDGCFDLLLNIKRVSKEQRSLLDLGYSKEHIEVFKNCLNDKKINILISGPSVSGKSTLLKGLVDFANQLNKNQKKVCTIEDPPEFKIDNVSQCPVVRYKEVDYSKFSPMQATYGYAKRFNPEIIMIGEIRNKYDGEILRLAEVEGYKILTSFVASSASGVLTRLTDEFGVNSENFLACYQRFVPKLCPHCAKKLDSDDFEMIEKIKNLCTDKQKVSMGLYPIKKQGSGCSKCGQQGYNGKAICLEMKFEKYKKDGQNNQIQKYLPEQIKGKTILDDAFLKILDGTCSPYDVETYIGGL